MMKGYLQGHLNAKCKGIIRVEIRNKPCPQIDFQVVLNDF